MNNNEIGKIVNRESAQEIGDEYLKFGRGFKFFSGVRRSFGTPVEWTGKSVLKGFFQIGHRLN